MTMPANESAPTLRTYMNWLALDGLPEFPAGPLGAMREAGYDGVQFIQPLSPPLVEEARKLGLGVCGSGRVNEPRDAEPLAAEARDAGLECLTLHLGWGLEDDDEAGRLIAAVLEASAKFGVPLYPETHRATIFQDMWRTVQFVRRFPELRFNGDFSHWYTGLEMVYGDFEKKVEFIRPVIERVRFLHGRIGNPGSMQVDIGNGDARVHPYVAHFRTLWTGVFEAFLRAAAPGDSICFTPELLSPRIYYARTFQGREESDRWGQSLELVRIARECFAACRPAYTALDNIPARPDE
jgi:sugar phosphate isomerase/epimerase